MERIKTWVLDPRSYLLLLASCLWVLWGSSLFLSGPFDEIVEEARLQMLARLDAQASSSTSLKRSFRALASTDRQNWDPKEVESLKAQLKQQSFMRNPDGASMALIYQNKILKGIGGSYLGLAIISTVGLLIGYQSTLVSVVQRLFKRRPRHE